MTQGEQAPGGDARRVLDRRNLLALFGSGALSTGLAGCQLLDDQSYEFAADPVVVDESTRTEQEYSERNRETLTETRTESVGGVEAEVTVRSEVAIYNSERDTEPLDIEGLWGGDDSALAVWSGGRPVRGARASALLDRSTMSSSPDIGLEVPTGAAQVWAPGAGVNAETGPGDLLVTIPAVSIEGPSGDRAIYSDPADSAFPPFTALDFEDGIYLE